MVINKNLTTVNFETTSNRNIQYIVIHYTANNGDTAKGNTDYFKSKYLGASAHYFVDTDSIWQCVEDKDIAWHCGAASGVYYNKCRNKISIGIEMCSVKINGIYSIPKKTIENTINLTKSLMIKYNIPIERVVRHYDVTHKKCPEPFVRDESQWIDFKNKLIGTNDSSNIHWCDTFKDKLLEKGIITDNEQWSNYDDYVTKGLLLALIDKATGGTWESEEASSAIHWVQPNLISLCGKGIITDKSQWEDYESYVSRALSLALVDKSTKNSDDINGTENIYVNEDVDHWARRNLNSLCDKGICNTVESWVDHWDEPITKADCMSLVYKAYIK